MHQRTASGHRPSFSAIRQSSQTASILRPNPRRPLHAVLGGPIGNGTNSQTPHPDSVRWLLTTSGAAPNSRNSALIFAPTRARRNGRFPNRAMYQDRLHVIDRPALGPVDPRNHRRSPGRRQIAQPASSSDFQNRAALMAGRKQIFQVKRLVKQPKIKNRAA